MQDSVGRTCVVCRTYVIRPALEIRKSGQTCNEPAVAELALLHVRSVHVHHKRRALEDFVHSFDGTGRFAFCIEVANLVDVKPGVPKAVETVALVWKIKCL
uniref:Uncharacterized protein n=1 Tax=Gibberella zeae TaxID=5518 RepID=A0A4E9EIG0_GIBZA